MLIKIAAGFPLAVLALIVWYVFYDNYDGNHSGMDIRLFWFLMAPGFAYLLYRWKEGYLPKIGAFLCVLCAAFILYLNVNNIMLYYDEWIERGMPDRGQPTLGKR